MFTASLRRVFAALLFIAIALPGASFAQSGDSAAIRALLQQRDAEIKTLLGTRDTFTDAQRDELKAVVNGAIDFRAMSAEALGDYWAPLTPAQKNEFVDVFSQIVRIQSLSNLDVYRARVAYDTITVEGDEAHVTTTTTYKDVPTRVEYKMGRSGDTWTVRDISLDGVSTVDGYARSFQNVIRKRDFATLMTSLNRRLARTQG